VIRNVLAVLLLAGETALPLRAEIPSFDGTRTVTFSDWRKVDGIAIAFGETWTTGPNKTTAHLQSIEFVPPDRIDLAKPSPGAEDTFYLRRGAAADTLPFNFDNNHIMVLTTVNGIGPIWFLVDTDANYSIINQSRVSEFHLTPYGGLTTIGGDAQRTVHKFSAPDVETFNPTNIRGLIDAVVIGGVTLPHVLVNLSAAKSGAYTSPAFSGNIGETLLSRFAHVILDYGRGVMILQPQPSTTRPFEERKTFGMTIIAGSPDLHHFTISAVGTDSAAAAAGFQKGDVITAIDRSPAGRWNLAGIRNVFTSDGTQHDVAVMRATQDVTIHATIAMTPVSGLR
jgi:hypothetical protein